MLLALAFVLLAVAVSASAPQASSALSGRLLLTTALDSSGGIPVEGYLNYFRLRDNRGRLLFERRSFRLDERLDPGAYRLAAYQRSCVGVCPPPGKPPPCTEDACPIPGMLDPPSPPCVRGLRIRPEQTLRVRLSVNFDRGYTLMLSSDRDEVQAAARRAASREVAQGGIDYLPHDWRVRCRMAAHFWACRVRSNTGQCAGTLRMRGIPGRLRARRVRIGCSE